MYLMKLHDEYIMLWYVIWLNHSMYHRIIWIDVLNRWRSTRHTGSTAFRPPRPRESPSSSPSILSAYSCNLSISFFVSYKVMIWCNIWNYIMTCYIMLWYVIWWHNSVNHKTLGIDVLNRWPSTRHTGSTAFRPPRPRASPSSSPSALSYSSYLHITQKVYCGVLYEFTIWYSAKSYDII